MRTLLISALVCAAYGKSIELSEHRALQSSPSPSGEPSESESESESASNSDSDNCPDQDPCGSISEECSRWRDVCSDTPGSDTSDSDSGSETDNDKLEACKTKAAKACHKTCKHTEKCFPARAAPRAYDAAMPCAYLWLGPVAQSCNVPWDPAAAPLEGYRNIIHPTQPEVGYAAVLHKRFDDMSSLEDAQAKMDGEDSGNGIPLIRYGAMLYATDGHHTQSAMDSTGFTEIMPKYKVACDYSHLDEKAFWAKMEAKGDTYLWKHPVGSSENVLPEPIKPDMLPRVFHMRTPTGSLSDNPWRSMAGVSRKTKDKEMCEYPLGKTDCGLTECKYPYGKHCNRAFNRKCGEGGTVINFFEYYWAYFFLDMVYSSSATPESVAFNTAYAALPAAFMGEYPDEDSEEKAYHAWKDAAALLMPIARSQAAADYALPAGFLTQPKLPGQQVGLGPITMEDGDCAGLGC